jgi:hypothetical protein
MLLGIFEEKKKRPPKAPPKVPPTAGTEVIIYEQPVYYEERK